MKNKIVMKSVAAFLSLVMLTSCIVPDSKNNTINTPVDKISDENKTFNTKDLESVRDKEIEIIQKDRDEPITVTITRENPINSPIKVGDMEIQPINRNYETVKGLTNEQIKQRRESLIKQWQVWYTGLIKVLREEVIKKQKSDQKIANNNFKKELEKYQLNSVEYNNLVNKYNLESDSMLTLQKIKWKNLK